jgi:hypothetical protein
VSTTEEELEQVVFQALSEGANPRGFVGEVRETFERLQREGRV